MKTSVTLILLESVYRLPTVPFYFEHAFLPFPFHAFLLLWLRGGREKEREREREGERKGEGERERKRGREREGERGERRRGRVLQADRLTAPN